VVDDEAQLADTHRVQLQDVYDVEVATSGVDRFL